MESTGIDDGNATHIMIEVMPPEEERKSHDDDSSVTSLRPMEEAVLDYDALLSSPLVTAELDSAGCQRTSQDYQVVFKPSTASFPQRKSYKVFLKPMKSPGQRKNFQVIFKAFGSAGASKVAELGHKNTVVCCKSPPVSLVKEKLRAKATTGGHSSVAHVAAKTVRNNLGLANNLPIQGPSRTSVSHSKVSESTPLKLDLKDHSLSWHSSPDLSRAIHESCVTNKGISKQRTPRTLTRLMQQHRDNERYRHRGLNASINDIIGRLPKRSKKSDHETKIVKLKRIINYICHLENYIRGLCSELELDLDFRQLFMTPNVKNLQVPKVDGGSCLSDELNYKSDWLSDCELEESKLDIPEYSQEAKERVERITTAAVIGSRGEDEMMTAPHLIMEDGFNVTETGQEMGQEMGQSVIPEYTFHSYDQCDYSQTQLEEELEVLEEFIKMSSAAEVDSSVNDSRTVSVQDFSCDGLVRPRMDDVFRTIDVNILHSDFPCEGDGSYISDRGLLPGQWNGGGSEELAGMVLPKIEKLDHDFDENVGHSFFGEEFSLEGSDLKQPQTVDFISSSVTDENKLTFVKGRGAGARRVTWMNGFMMYSHLQRQNYIRANCGLRNSHITKLMASDWRRMDPAEQQPYRDQAKCYVESRLQMSESSQPNY